MLAYVWLTVDSILFIVGSLYLYNQNLLPKLFVTLFTYGKASSSSNGISQFFKVFLVPKSYFRHFYISSVVLFTCLTILLGSPHLLSNDALSIANSFLLFIKYNEQTEVSRLTVVTLSSLMLIQSLRRFYECFFISIYNKTTQMSIIHYIAGFAFYFGVALSVLQISPLFETKTSMAIMKQIMLNDMKQLTFWQAIGITIFIWASWNQNKAHRTLANLRKDRKGATCNDKYKIPRGDWFNMVSNPHFTAEILIYASLCLVSNAPTLTWAFLWLWVVIGQIFAGIMSHRWYETTFGNTYPKRFAIIPYVL